MKNMDKRLPDAELEVMKAIWHNWTPISTSEVKQCIDEEGVNQWTQQTLQSLLNRLIAKGFLEKGKRGKEYIYTPLVEERDYIDFESRQFLKKLHGNSVASLMRAFFDRTKLSDDDVAKLEKMFRESRE